MQTIKPDPDTSAWVYQKELWII